MVRLRSVLLAPGGAAQAALTPLFRWTQRTLHILLHQFDKHISHLPAFFDALDLEVLRQFFGAVEVESRRGWVRHHVYLYTDLYKTINKYLSTQPDLTIGRL